MHLTTMGIHIYKILATVMVLLLWATPLAAAPRPVIPSGSWTGWEWQTIPDATKQAYCVQAFAAFRSSPAQSYIISHGVQSLQPEGLCDRMEQFFSIEDNRDTPLATAAALAPLLYADTPLGTRY